MRSLGKEIFKPQLFPEAWNFIFLPLIMYSFAHHIRRGSPGLFRQLATVAPSKRQAREGGTISDIFTTLKPGEEHAALPDRFSALKKEMFKDELVESWRQVLAELEGTVAEITEKGNNVCLQRLSPHWFIEITLPLAGCPY